MLRRSACLLSRLGPQAAAAAECGGSSAWAPQSAAALHVLESWQQHSGSSGQGGGWQQHQHLSIRSFSLWPGGGRKKEPPASEDLTSAGSAGGEGFGSSNAAQAAGIEATSSSAGFAADTGGGLAAAASSPGVSDLFTASAIVAAAAGAEEDALAACQEDSWIGTRGIQMLLRGVHSATGLEWWQSIMLATLGMRIATLPIMLMQVKNTYRMSQARPEIEELVNIMKEEQARGNSQAAMQHQHRVLAVWAKYKCNPMKSLAGMFVQAPIFIGFFSALRGFAAHKVPSLAEGGTLWFTDLTVADPTYMLPALAGLSFLATIELGAADGMQGQPEEMQKKMKTMMRVVALAVPLVSASLPASVFMYWSASNVFSLVQSSLLKLPAVKRAVGLPDLAQVTPGAQAQAQAQLIGKPVQTFTSRPPRKAPTKPRKDE
ncbi:hypothetical protein D9Q98_006183 [Chlorella vulgaris]|uniref:Membrane insertase YidC/Oxa/ALB C-terminal domain-containing protein n=1 Tax=Chlorella vulgaris TaxID=3077 RepID=A0A9D4Z140_CHLVU|nr:hypothetical protein D9Q98_006183 [Chlorella vulgaris]